MDMKCDIVFLQQYPLPHYGILAMEPYLRHSGRSVEVVIDTLERDATAAIKALNPKVVGISVMSVEHHWLIRAIRALHTAMPGLPIIVGGIHGILYPERILRETSASLVCHGDGEEVLPAILDRLDTAAASWNGFAGVAFRGPSGTIVVNERAPLTPYRDDMREDRSMYYRRYPAIGRVDVHNFFSSRGCPYDCKFCLNPRIRAIFRGCGPVFRRKSPGVFADEIAAQTRGLPVRTIYSPQARPHPPDHEYVLPADRNGRRRTADC